MAYDFKDITILLVEDNEPMLKILQTVLQSFGVGRVATALNGNEAFEKYCQINPDIVITDWMMDPCDGVALSKKIRNLPQSPNQFVPIILMSGFSQESRVIRARDNGVTEFLVKPFNARDMYKRVYQIIEKPRKFVRAEGFFGPDRRRKRDPSKTKANRRQEDTKKSVTTNNDDNNNVDNVDFR